MSKQKFRVKAIKRDGETIAFKVNKNDLTEDEFDSRYEIMCKKLDADRLKMKNHDENQIIVYDKDQTYYG